MWQLAEAERKERELQVWAGVGVGCECVCGHAWGRRWGPEVPCGCAGTLTVRAALGCPCKVPVLMFVHCSLTHARLLLLLAGSARGGGGGGPADSRAPGGGGGKGGGGRGTGGRPAGALLGRSAGKEGRAYVLKLLIVSKLRVQTV